MFSPLNSCQSLSVASQFMSLYDFTVSVCNCTYTRNIFIGPVSASHLGLEFSKLTVEFLTFVSITMKNVFYLSFPHKVTVFYGFNCVHTRQFLRWVSQPFIFYS